MINYGALLLWRRSYIIYTPGKKIWRLKRKISVLLITDHRHVPHEIFCQYQVDYCVLHVPEGKPFLSCSYFSNDRKTNLVSRWIWLIFGQILTTVPGLETKLLFIFQWMLVYGMVWYWQTPCVHLFTYLFTHLLGFSTFKKSEIRIMLTLWGIFLDFWKSRKT